MTLGEFFILILAFIIALPAMVLLMIAIGLDWLIFGKEIRDIK